MWDSRPHCGAFARHSSAGIEELLEAALRKDLSKRVPFWEERLEALVLQQSREIRVPMGAGGGTELAAMATLWERTAGSPGSKYCPETPEAAVEGLLSVYRHSREHYAKITASLLPALSMLTAGALGESLSPEFDLTGKTDDPRPIVSLEDVISMQGVLYLGLDALPDAETASALGALLLSDLSAQPGAATTPKQAVRKPCGPVFLWMKPPTSSIRP